MRYCTIVYKLISSGHTKIGVNQGLPAIHTGGPVLLDVKFACHRDLLDAKPDVLEEYVELVIEELASTNSKQ